jgi:protein involved in polysaccharide export with SLBB domain
MKIMQFFLTFNLVFFLASCSTRSKTKYETINDSLNKTPAQEEQATRFEEVDEALVAPGYAFRLSHPNDKDLAGLFRVQFDGTIILPYKIKLDTKGLKVDEFRSKVISTFQGFFKPGSPSVSFTLSEKKYWVEVDGLVNKSGKFLIEKNTSFDELMALAQGISKEAKTEDMTAKITQGDKIFEIDLNHYYSSGDKSDIPPWRGADLVFIKKTGGMESSSNRMVKILGEVRIPGDVPHLEGADLYYYLSKAGGQTNTVDIQKYEIIRTENNKKVAILFDPTKVETVPAIKAGDVIHLYPYRESLTEKTLRIISYLGTIITATAVLIIAL